VLLMKKKRTRYGAELKAEICRLVILNQKTVPGLADEHRICASSVYAWVRQARIDAGEGPKDAATSAEHLAANVAQETLC
jgi:transposase-like protein